LIDPDDQVRTPYAQPLSRVACHAAQAIAAHASTRPIAVEDGQCDIAAVPSTRHVKNLITADAESPIAQPRHHPGDHVRSGDHVVDQDEVVPATLVLEKVQWHQKVVSIRGDSQRPGPYHRATVAGQQPAP
jgi:hypothetical protein